MPDVRPDVLVVIKRPLWGRRLWGSPSGRQPGGVYPQRARLLRNGSFYLMSRAKTRLQSPLWGKLDPHHKNREGRG